MSTSTVTLPFAKGAGFGAVNHGGYGIGYIVKDKITALNITSYKSHPDTDSSQFAHYLNDSLIEIKNALRQKN